MRSIDRSIDPCRLRQLNDERPRTEHIHDLIRNMFRRWFSQHRKAILRDELYAPSCQRLTRPAPLCTYTCLTYAPSFHPVGAPSCFSQTVPDTSTGPFGWKRKLDLLPANRAEHFSFIRNALRAATFLSRSLSNAITLPKWLFFLSFFRFRPKHRIPQDGKRHRPSCFGKNFGFETFVVVYRRVRNTEPVDQPRLCVCIG